MPDMSDMFKSLTNDLMGKSSADATAKTQEGGRRRRRRTKRKSLSKHKRHTKSKSRRRRRRRVKHGGGMLETAAVPFGLLGMQKYFHKKGRKHSGKRTRTRRRRSRK